MKQSVLILCSAFLVLAVFGVDTSWARKPNKAARVATSSGTQSTQQVYNNLLEQQKNIGSQISALSLQLHSASAPKGRKITQQINLLSDDLVVIERKLTAFPSKYTGASNPDAQYASPVDDAFARELDSIATLRVAGNNPFAGQLSTDPELDRMYRAYLKAYGDGVVVDERIEISVRTPAVGANAPTTKGLVYRVMVAISKVSLSPSDFSGIPDVVEQTMPAGGYVYYSGQYSSLGHAQQACDQILSRHKFRDAFVVAMDGGRRVPIRK